MLLRVGLMALSLLAVGALALGGISSTNASWVEVSDAEAVGLVGGADCPDYTLGAGYCKEVNAVTGVEIFRCNGQSWVGDGIGRYDAQQKCCGCDCGLMSPGRGNAGCGS